jgi:biotin carboxyl carrier protein
MSTIDTAAPTSRAQQNAAPSAPVQAELLVYPLPPAPEATGLLPTPDAQLGERFHMLERLVVAPAAGKFEPTPPQTVTAEGEIVYRGQTIGSVTSRAEHYTVTSNFTGFLGGFLAMPGERVRPGQPLAWLHSLETASRP